MSDNNPNASHPKDSIARTLAIIGAIVAAFGLAVAIRTDIRSQAGEHQQFIRDAYGTFLEMDHFQMQQPEISHEYCRPGDYPTEKARVQRAFASATPEERAKLLLREEGFAFYVFSAFERLVFLKRAPESTRTKELDRFLNEQLRYFAQDVLPNPRLVYYWRDQHGYLYYNQETSDYYSQLVPNLRQLQSDPQGPFQ